MLLCVVILRRKKQEKQREIVLIVYNVRSAYNVGSFFRTADGAGVSHMYLIGFTPTPITRFGVPQKEIAKTALGAEMTIRWSHANTVSPVLTKLRKQGFQIVALEQTPASIPVADFKPKQKVALVLGSELGGVPNTVLNKCDAAIEIPMRGLKNSLNVSVATGIALYALTSTSERRVDE